MSMTKPNSTNCRVVKGCMSNNLCVCHCSSTDGLTTTATSPQATSLAVSWTPERTLTANGYTISYSNTNDGCFTDSRSGITTRMKSYVLTGLEEGTEYSITVTATLTGGRTEEDTITASTRTAVPSAPPSSVKLSVKSSTSITVRWGPVECRHRNGEIIGYSMRSGKAGASEEDRAVRMASGSTIKLHSLSKQTVYTVEVAARTSTGIGVYSEPQTIMTPDNVFLSLNGKVIPNRGYVLIRDIGYTDDTALLCYTNRPPRGSPNDSGGNWYKPDGTTEVDAVAVTGLGFRRNRGPKVVRLKRRTGTGARTPSEGIYRCEIEDSESTQTLYVGLYNRGGGHLKLSGNMTFTLNTDNSFTLTCISTGGPPTTVSWTRDSTPVAEGTTETVLNDPVTANYTHTLTSTARAVGLYKCMIANNVSNASAQLLVQEPANISLTSSPPSPIMSGATVILTCSISLPIAIPDTSGIQWEGPEVIPDPDNSINSERKIISVLTLSQIETLQSGLYKCNFSFSGSVSASMTIEILDQVVFLPAIVPDATLITLSWFPASGVPVTTYNISYSNTNTECFSENITMSVDNETLSYTLKELQEHTEYSVKVYVWYKDRVVGSNMTMVTTKPVAPSAPPSAGTVTSVSSSTITLGWGSVPCIHQNGEITGYTVRYGATGSGDKQTVETRETEVTLSSLTPGTNYEISVAAVNGAGTGPYSTVISIRTTESGSISDEESVSSAIIGGVVAVVIVLIISITIVTIIVLILKSRREDVSLKNNNSHKKCVSTVTESGGGIPTSTNEAYGRVGGGTEREEGYEMVEISTSGPPPPATLEGMYEVPSPGTEEKETAVYDVIPGDNM